LGKIIHNIFAKKTDNL